MVARRLSLTEGLIAGGFAATLIASIAIGAQREPIDYANPPASVVQPYGFGSPHCTVPAGPAGVRLVDCPDAAAPDAAELNASE